MTTNKPKPTPNSTADVGVSRRALSIARTIDRLPEGEYTLRVTKRTIEAWQFEVVKGETVIRKELRK